MMTARRPCCNFSRSGSCRFGANCRFAHGDALPGTQGRLNAGFGPQRTSYGVPFSVHAMRAKLTKQLTSDFVRERGISDPLTVLWESNTSKQDTRWKRFLLLETTDNPRELATQMDVLIFCELGAARADQEPEYRSAVCQSYGPEGRHGRRNHSPLCGESQVL